MTLSQSFRTCFGAYGSLLAGRMPFAGRAPRSEFWWFQLPWLAVVPVFFFSLVILIPSINRHGHLTGEAVTLYPVFVAFYLASAAYFVVTLIPNVAVTLRRLHDTGRSGWWCLIALLQFGVLVVLIFLTQKGTPGRNHFGQDPLGGGRDA